jgi:hypothetical protein
MPTRSLLSTVLIAALMVIAPAGRTVDRVTATPPPELSITRMGLGNIKLGDSDTQVKRILGQPKTVKTEATNCCGPLQTWSYGDIEVSFEEREVPRRSPRLSVYQVTTRSAKFATLDLVRVGDRRSKVLKVYGPATSADPDKLYYANNRYASFLAFEFKGDQVVAISASTLLN